MNFNSRVSAQRHRRQLTLWTSCERLQCTAVRIVQVAVVSVATFSSSWLGTREGKSGI
eukprot:Gb_40816 [translate_table: standard]